VRTLPTILAAALALGAALAAETAAPDPAARVRAALDPAEAPDAATLAELLPLMAEASGRNALRTRLLAADREFPAAALVANLGHELLAVRLGALELLEERAGGSFEFNPWEAPDQPSNQRALARWRDWAGGEGERRADGPLLGEDQRRGYLRDLLGDHPEKAGRARRMLESDGLDSVGFLESFLEDNPQLVAGKRARVRQAQYQIVLAGALGEQAALTARHLCFGSRDQTLEALASLRGAGLVSLPILRDFIEHPDSLIRESAIDAMLASAGAGALPLVGPVLRREPDVNVLHGALRQLKDIPGEESARLTLGLLDHDNEDLIVSALQTALKLSGGGSRSGPFGNDSSQLPADLVEELQAKVLALLDDPRWRVRVAALEFVTDRGLEDASEQVLARLDDPDEFVRFRAIKAAARLRPEGTAEKFKSMFLADPEIAGPVLEGYAALGRQPDAEMRSRLATYPIETRLAAIRAAESNSALIPMLAPLAEDEDLDVACAALRLLGSKAEHFEDPRLASVMVRALDEGLEAKRGALLDRLRLPESEFFDPQLNAVLERLQPDGEATSLDPLYDAFAPVAGEAEHQIETLPNAQAKVIEHLGAIAGGDADDWFRAAIVLADAGHPEGFAPLVARFDQLSTAQKSAVAESLAEPSRHEAVELFRQLLREPVSEVRSAAARAALSADASAAFAALVFDELSRPDAALRAHELYDYTFHSALRENRVAPVLRRWAGNTLGDDDAPDPDRVLALIALHRALDADALEQATRLARRSPSPWLRRAAWWNLGHSRPGLLLEHLDELRADESPQVRIVLAAAHNAAGFPWRHRFDDLHDSSDSSWGRSDGQTPRPDAATLAALEEMATRDPAPRNRFEAAFTLLTHGRPIDAEAFARLLPQQPETARASYRVADWMHDHLAQLGPGLAPVLGAIDTRKIQPQWVRAIAEAVTPGSDGAALTSFSALVESADLARDAPQLTATPEPAEPAVDVVRDSLKLVFFFKPGCRECVRTERFLELMKKDFPKLEVESHNILEASSTLLNQALCDRFGVPSDGHNLAPSIFTQAGFLVREAIQPASLAELLGDTMRLPENDAWAVIGQPEIAAARDAVEQRFAALDLPLVLGAGLLDGVNPCAFATIIFFLSYLQIARRTPREMLMVGFAFILAVFLAYLLAGLALHHLLATLSEQISGLQRWLNLGFGALALLAAGLSFRDAWLARRGRAEEMSLQLPGFLKSGIRQVARSGARARRFVIAAFLAGFVISILELACTGQVYAPIIYRIQQGATDAVLMLVAYNLAFITPLVVVFLAAWAGLRSETLIRIQKRFTATVKVALGLLFLLLAAMMLLGDRVLPG